MAHVFDFNDSNVYDAWFQQARNRYVFDLEMGLITRMIAPVQGERLLDIGCGTGMGLEHFLSHGLQVTGVDPSPYMLDIARKKLRNRADLHRAFAEDLPFDDNAFETAVLMTSLEFTERPAKAIEEACRVAKDRVVIGVLNLYAPLNLIRKARGYFFQSIYSHAHFFGIWELKQILFAILGEAPVTWKTTLQFPGVTGKAAQFVENLSLVQKSPFGTMICMEIKPVPKFRTRPLSLKVKKSAAYKPVSGFARNLCQEKHEDTVLHKAG
ncbi:MAG: class I SAM-dependent methyltransferase [Pseudomonadota bacterium]